MDIEGEIVEEDSVSTWEVQSDINDTLRDDNCYLTAAGGLKRLKVSQTLDQLQIM